MNNLKHKIDRVIEKILIVLETLIAILTMVVLVALLGIELYHMISDPTYFLAEEAVSKYLHEILSIVIGLEFVKLLLHLTPANILEVLTMALARGIIVNHGSAVDNLLSIVCIVALFAAKRYLIPKNELHQDMDDTSHYGGSSRRHKHNKHVKHPEHTEHREEKQEVH